MFGIRLYFIKRVLRQIKARSDYYNIPRARKGFENAVRPYNRKRSGFTYTPATIAGMKSEWIAPNGCDESKVLLYFHGGGYATGSILTHRSLVSHLAKCAGIKALIIEYRLAPENKYPAPIDDATAAYQWLLQNGYAASKIAFGGDSAGGGICLGTLLYLRDENIPLPKCAIALSPWVDHTMSGESYHHNKEIDPMLVFDGFAPWSKNYIGEANPKAPYASPIFHNLTGMPPIFIQVGEEEMLLDDSKSYAAKAKVDGVDVTLEVYPKKFHVFNAFWRILPKAREANEKLGAFMKKQLNS